MLKIYYLKFYQWVLSTTINYIKKNLAYKNFTFERITGKLSGFQPCLSSQKNSQNLKVLKFLLNFFSYSASNWLPSTEEIKR